MKYIKLLIVSIIGLFILPCVTKAFTSLEISTPNPVKGSDFYIQLNIDYLVGPKDPEIKDFHTIIVYDPEYFEYAGSTWTQGVNDIRIENGRIYIDKKNNGQYWPAKISPIIVRFTAKKVGSSNMSLQRGEDSHYKNGDVIAQSLSGVPINVVAPSTNTDIGSLGVEGYVLQPTFKKSTTTYNLTVQASVAQVKIVAQSSDKKQTITGTGNVFLDYGLNVFPVVVKAQDGSSKTYTIRITRLDDRTGDTSLKSISVSDTTIKYKKGVTSYEATVSRSVESVLITARTNDVKATLIGTGRKQLEIGKNTFSISVTSSNNKQTIYHITIYRSTEELERVVQSSKLKTLKVNNLGVDLTNNTKNRFFFGVKNEVVNLPITAVGISSTADIEITGDKKLKEGINPVTIKVTEVLKEATETTPAEEDITTYNLIVYRNYDNTEVISDLKNFNTNKNLVYNTSSSSHKIPASTINYLKNNNKKLYYNVINMYGGILYQAALSGELSSGEIDASFTAKPEDSYTYQTNLPKDTEMLLYLGDLYEDETSIRIYTYNEDGKYTLLTDGITVMNGYIEFKLNGDKNYVFTTLELVKEKGPLEKLKTEYGPLVWAIVVIMIIAVLYMIILNKYKEKKALKEPSY